MHFRLASPRRGCVALVAAASMGAAITAGAIEPVEVATVALPAPPVAATAAIDMLPASWYEVKQRPVSTIGAPVDVSRLSGMRGGSDEQQSVIVVDGTVDGNTADRIASGGNSITSGAFDNANGINTVIQNTGTNVLIQNAMVVTVNFVEPTR